MCNKFFVFSINLVIIFMFSVNVNAATCTVFETSGASSIVAVTDTNCINLCSYSDKDGNYGSQIIYYSSYSNNFDEAALVINTSETDYANSNFRYAFYLDSFKTYSNISDDAYYDVIVNGCPSLSIIDAEISGSSGGTGLACFSNSSVGCNDDKTLTEAERKEINYFYYPDGSKTWYSTVSNYSKLTLGTGGVNFSDETVLNNITYNFENDFSLVSSSTILHNIESIVASGSIVDELLEDVVYALDILIYNSRTDYSTIEELGDIIGDNLVWAIRQVVTSDYYTSTASEFVDDNYENYVKFNNGNVIDVFKDSLVYIDYYNQYDIIVRGVLYEEVLLELGYTCSSSSDIIIMESGNIEICEGAFSADYLESFLMNDEEFKNIYDEMLEIIEYKQNLTGKEEDNDVSSAFNSMVGSMDEYVSGYSVYLYTPYSNSSSVEYDFGDSVDCGSILGDTTDPTDTAYYLQLALNVIKYAGIIALLGMTILDYTKAVAESDADGLKKANLRTIKRLAYTVLLFLFPIILEYVFVLVGIYTDTTDPFCGIS